MSIEFQTQSHALISSPAFREAKGKLIEAVTRASAQVRGVRPGASGEARNRYLEVVQNFQKNRGRELFFPFLSSGLGSGPFVELQDGSVKYDLITGIGICFFGHSHPQLMGEIIDGIAADLYQGNLQPGHEAAALLDALISRAAKGSRIKHGWLTTCGTMANEIALKMIRQKKFPATKVLAFRDCFCGRSTAMQEITDNPKYRDGQPLYGEVQYLTFFDSSQSLQANIDKTLGEMREHLDHYPGKFAALMIEPVQGEGGFNFAPRDWYVKVFEEAQKAGLAIWLDEIQSFGRTSELFAYQAFGLGEYVDVVTAAKMLQAAVVLYTEEYNPKPGLVAGTFSGASVALRAARRTLEMLDDGFFGKEGKIQKLSDRFVEQLQKVSAGSCKGAVTGIKNYGGMIAFQPFSGTLEDAKALLLKLFDLGVVAFYCGHGPILIRLLPPLGAMTEQDVDQVCSIIEKAVTELKGSRA